MPLLFEPPVIQPPLVFEIAGNIWAWRSFHQAVSVQSYRGAGVNSANVALLLGGGRTARRGWITLLLAPVHGMLHPCRLRCCERLICLVHPVSVRRCVFFLGLCLLCLQDVRRNAPVASHCCALLLPQRPSTWSQGGCVALRHRASGACARHYYGPGWLPTRK